MKVVAVIPARLASTRLPRKMLREIAGEPLIVRVYRSVERCRLLSEIVVATDAEEIQEACRQRGIPARMTSSSHRSGTEREHEISCLMNADVYLNIQGDEPLIDPAVIDAVAGALLLEKPIDAHQPADHDQLAALGLDDAVGLAHFAVRQRQRVGGAA